MSDYSQDASARVEAHRTGETHSLIQPAGRAGSYNGNDAVNRAIPHGLGRIPNIVIVKNHTAGTIYLIDVTGSMSIQAGASDFIVSVTAPDATNLYVGDGANKFANDSPKVFYWGAL